MTETEQIQYERFILAGYSTEDADMLIERGVWLGTTDVSEKTVADIQRYRAERDERGDLNAADTPLKPTP